MCFFFVITLILSPLSSVPEVTAADKAGETRRLAVREEVDAAQASLLSRAENGDKLQVPPSEVFSLVGAKLAATKPVPFENEAFRAPSTEPAAEQEASAEEEPAAPASEEPAATEPQV